MARRRYAGLFAPPDAVGEGRPLAKVAPARMLRSKHAEVISVLKGILNTAFSPAGRIGELESQAKEIRAELGLVLGFLAEEDVHPEVLRQGVRHLHAVVRPLVANLQHPLSSANREMAGLQPELLKAMQLMKVQWEEIDAMVPARLKGDGATPAGAGPLPGEEGALGGGNAPQRPGGLENPVAYKLHTHYLSLVKPLSDAVKAEDALRRRIQQVEAEVAWGGEQVDQIHEVLTPAAGQADVPEPARMEALLKLEMVCAFAEGWQHELTGLREETLVFMANLSSSVQSMELIRAQLMMGARRGPS